MSPASPWSAARPARARPGRRRRSRAQRRAAQPRAPGAAGARRRSRRQPCRDAHALALPRRPHDRGSPPLGLGDWRGSGVRLPHSPNAPRTSGPAGRRATPAAFGWYAREIDATVAGRYALRFESAHYRARVTSTGLQRSHVGAYEPFSARPALAAGATSWPSASTGATRCPSDEDWQRGWFNYGGLQRPGAAQPPRPSELGALRVRTRVRGGGRARVDITVARAHAARARVRLTGSLVRDGEAVALRFGGGAAARRLACDARVGRARGRRAVVARSPRPLRLRIGVAGEASCDATSAGAS